MKSIVDPAAEFVPAVERVFGVQPRVLDGSRAVLVGDVKLTLEAGERELWLVRMHTLALACLQGQTDVADLDGSRPVEDARADAEDPFHGEDEVRGPVDDGPHRSRSGTVSNPRARSSA